MPSELEPRRAADRAPLLDIAGRRTLPGWAYTDAALWAAEWPGIFYRHWQYAGHDCMLETPGSYFTIAINDQELVLIRGQDGEVRAFYNVCAHRGHPLVEGAGQRQRLVCPYHAWTYDLAGQLIGAPGSNRTDGFVRSDICLSPVRVERLLGFLFVNLDPDALPLAEYAAGLADALRDKVPGIEGFRPQKGNESFSAEIAANWKVVVDNFLECYHCEPAHPSFSDMLDVPGTRHGFGANYTHQYIPSACKAENAAYPIDLEHDFTDGNFWLLYPNTTFGYLPGSPNLTVSRIESLAPGRCRRFRHIYGQPGVWTERDEKRRRWTIESVVAEDIRLCEAVQRGMHSRGFDRGHYIVNPAEENFTEECLRFFHRRYAEDMGAALAG
jgi:phenylpropionate dioxygenase-like ring-hydroxylating dioxygenase large terminal subunit